MNLLKPIFTVLNIYTSDTKTMPNYRYGKIYKIVCHTTDKIYIGSTCQPLDTRLAEHERSYTSRNYTRKYCTAFEIIKHNNYTMRLLENCSCVTKQELHMRESFHILNNVCVNKNIPLRSPLEYRRSKKNKITKYNIEYRQTPAGKETSKRAALKYESSAKGKVNRKWKDRMRQQHGDRYCNSLMFISWDVFQ